MLPIPGGKFTIGSPKSEAKRGDDEGPQREVEIKPFWMAKCEVTWDESTTSSPSASRSRRRSREG